MKKIRIVLVVLCCLTSHEVMAHNGVYVYTGDAFVTTGFTFDKLSSDKSKTDNVTSYRLNTTLISAGLGYRSQYGGGIELGVLGNYSFLKDNDNFHEGLAGICVRVYQTSSISRNCNWMFALSYRYLSVSQSGYSGRFHDLLIEPFVFEYLTDNKHWGFQVSLVSLEAMANIPDVASREYDTNAGYAVVGVSVNSFPVKIVYYF